MHKEDNYFMKFFDHIFRRHAPMALSILAILAFAVIVKVFAVSGGPFNAAETLDPDCVPGGTCQVNIFPDQAGNSGKFLKTNGSAVSWDTAGGGSLSTVLTAGNDTGANDIFINTASSRRIMQDDGAPFFLSGTFSNGILFSQTSGLQFFSSNYSGLVGVGVVTATISPTTFIVNGDSSFPGIQYQDDYSANFTNRSLVDKAYVDANAGGMSAESGTFTLSADGTSATGGALSNPGSNPTLTISTAGQPKLMHINGGTTVATLDYAGSNTGIIVGEEVVGQSSGARAVVFDDDTDAFRAYWVSGVFTPGENITGQTSSVTLALDISFPPSYEVATSSGISDGTNNTILSTTSSNNFGTMPPQNFVLSTEKVVSQLGPNLRGWTAQISNITSSSFDLVFTQVGAGTPITGKWYAEE